MLMPNPSQFLAASRIVEIQSSLVSEVMGSDVRAELMHEQHDLWEYYFPGLPYEQVAETLTN